MAGNANRLLILWRDYRGAVGKMVVFVAAAVLDPSGAAVQAVKTALELLSKAVVTKESITVTTQGESAINATEDGAHSDIDDRIRLTFVDADGQYHRYEVPSPGPTNFDATDPTLLGAATQVPTPPYFAVVTSIETYCESPSGAALTFVEALYYRRKGDIA